MAKNMSCERTAGDQSMRVQHRQFAESVTGEVWRPFNQVVGKAAQQLRLILLDQVVKMASLYVGKRPSARWESKYRV